MLTLLNTSILTDFGGYEYTPISVKEVLELQEIRENCTACFGNHPCQYCGGSGYFTHFQSAIGHQATADILTKILGVPVPMNRIEYKQKLGEKALVFKLNGRAEEGKILTTPEIMKIGFSFGILERTK